MDRMSARGERAHHRHTRVLVGLERGQRIEDECEFHGGTQARTAMLPHCPVTPAGRSPVPRQAYRSAALLLLAFLVRALALLGRALALLGRALALLGRALAFAGTLGGWRRRSSARCRGCCAFGRRRCRTLGRRRRDRARRRCGFTRRRSLLRCRTFGRCRRDRARCRWRAFRRRRCRTLGRRRSRSRGQRGFAWGGALGTGRCHLLGRRRRNCARRGALGRRRSRRRTRRRHIAWGKPRTLRRRTLGFGTSARTRTFSRWRRCRRALRSVGGTLR